MVEEKQEKEVEGEDRYTLDRAPHKGTKGKGKEGKGTEGEEGGREERRRIDR